MLCVSRLTVTDGFLSKSRPTKSGPSKPGPSKLAYYTNPNTNRHPNPNPNPNPISITNP